jgi:hypothetical protein
MASVGIVDRKMEKGGVVMPGYGKGGGKGKRNDMRKGGKR